jgi:7-cyano-7-deazaguanine synthase in queuosine biosynthesis
MSETEKTISFTKHLPPLILLSGGLDSTALVYSKLKAGINVATMYIDGNQHQDKVIAEKATRKKILAEFQRMYDKREVEGRVISDVSDIVDERLIRAGADTFCLSQAWAWFSNAFTQADGFMHSSVEIAYVLNDSASSELYRLQEAWKILYASLKKGPLVPLEFPFMRTYKECLYDELPSRLRKLVWVCETPIITHTGTTKEKRHECGTCPACKRHTALIGGTARKISIPSGNKETT